LLPKPRVVLKVVFHKLLDVFLGAAVVLSGGSVYFRLQLGRQMHFHDFLD
jgi:hypothetical protein